MEKTHLDKKTPHREGQRGKPKTESLYVHTQYLEIWIYIH